TCAGAPWARASGRTTGFARPWGGTSGRRRCGRPGTTRPCSGGIPARGSWRVTSTYDLAPRRRSRRGRNEAVVGRGCHPRPTTYDSDLLRLLPHERIRRQRQHVRIGGSLGELLGLRRVALALPGQRRPVEHLRVLLVRLPEVSNGLIVLLLRQRDATLQLVGLLDPDLV